MNPVNRFFLMLVMLPAKAYSRMGIDVDQLRFILRIKLLMDDRRPNTLQMTNQKKQNKPIRMATLGTMLMSAIMGSFFLIGFIVGNDMVTHLTIYFSFFIFVLASTLISDFTSVLIDIRDNMIILPKPVSDKTFVVSRLLHIIIHISKMVLPMILPAIIYLYHQLNVWSIFPFLFIVAAATLFTVFLINALYILILKITTPERFKTIISYFQIFFAIAFYASYQLVPRLINKAALEHYTIVGNPWAWLAPPFWFAGGFDFLTAFNGSFAHVIAFVMSVSIPLMAIYTVIRYFAPSFNQKLSMISGSGSESITGSTSSKQKSSNGSGLINTISTSFTKTGAERMSFMHTWKMISRSRDFKMKVYPSLGYLLVYLAVVFLNNKKITLHDIRDQTISGKIIFFSLIYFSSFMLIMAVSQIMYSEKYKAAWVYFITPIAKPGALISGAMKAILTKFYLPLISIITILSILLIGPKIMPNLLLGLFNQLLILYSVAYISMRSIPFSQMQNQTKPNFIRAVFTLIIPSSIAIMHYLIYSFMPVVLILSVLSGIALWLVADAIARKEWSSIQNGYRD